MDLLYQLDPNHDGKITFDEFQQVMKYIEQRFGSKNQQSNDTFQQTSRIGDEDKRKYGAMLPKVGVNFLPDDKIVAFLK